MRDKDGNYYDVGLISTRASGRREPLVEITANVVWLTPAKALVFARRIQREVERARRAQKANT